MGHHDRRRLHVQGWLGGPRSLAVTVMTIALLLILVVPLYSGIEAIVGSDPSHVPIGVP